MGILKYSTSLGVVLVIGILALSGTSFSEKPVTTPVVEPIRGGSFDEVVYDGCTYLIFKDVNGINVASTYGNMLHKANCTNSFHKIMGY